MDTCSYFPPNERRLIGLSTGIIWAVFALIWLCLTSCCPRPNRIGMELFIGLVGVLCSISGFIEGVTPWCEVGTQVRWLPYVLVGEVTGGVFVMLQVFIARGYGITRFQLTLTELVGLGIGCVAVVVAVFLWAVSLIYPLFYLFFLIFSCQTYSLLGSRDPSISPLRQETLSKKQQLFLSMLLLLFSAILLTFLIHLSKLLSDSPAISKYMYLCLLGIVEIMYAMELLLLLMNRNEREWNDLLVSMDDVYVLLKPLLEGNRYFQAENHPQYPQYYPPEQYQPYNQPQNPQFQYYLPPSAPYS